MLDWLPNSGSAETSTAALIMGAALHDDLPPMFTMRAAELKHWVPGWDGVDGGEEEDSTTCDGRLRDIRTFQKVYDGWG